MATGMARGAWKRGKRIAFGDGTNIIWDHHSARIFKNNPNIATLEEGKADYIEWINFYRGHRIYNDFDAKRNRWIWNYNFHAIPGEINFEIEETKFGAQFGEGFILVEPRVPRKHGATNKAWHSYPQLIVQLRKAGYRVITAEDLKAPGFRHALAALKRAALFIGPEGGLHHGAAAVGTPAVVIFGSWIPPQVTGYASHTNLARGKACGHLYPCSHCQREMSYITLKNVMDAALSHLSEAKYYR